MTELIIIYLIGYVLSYYLWRKELRIELKEKYSWSVVFKVCIVSLGSFITVIMTLIARWCENTKIKKSKPPKFL